MIYLSHFEKRDAPEAAGAPYPFGVPLIKEFSALELTRPVTIFCGENGSGKTTLLELMAGQCGANRISAPDSQSTSSAALTQAARYFRGARTAKPRTVFLFSAETFTRYIEFLYAEKREAEAELQRVKNRFGAGAREYAEQPYARTVGEIQGMYENELESESHGQGFLDFFASRIRLPGLYFIDEPEAALSYANQLALLYMMREAEARGAQFVLATHSPVIAAYPGASLYELLEGRLVETAYDELSGVSFLRHWLSRHDDFFKDEERFL